MKNAQLVCSIHFVFGEMQICGIKCLSRASPNQWTRRPVGPPSPVNRVMCLNIRTLGPAKHEQTCRVAWDNLNFPGIEFEFEWNFASVDWEFCWNGGPNVEIFRWNFFQWVARLTFCNFAFGSEVMGRSVGSLIHGNAAFVTGRHLWLRTVYDPGG